MKSTGLLLVMLAAVIGCATPTIYSWGHFEGVLYALYVPSDKLPPERQVELMEADFQKAQSLNQPLPPGWHAHLGYLYYKIGKMDQARQEFTAEKTRFPESAVFMDRLLTNLEKK